MVLIIVGLNLLSMFELFEINWFDCLIVDVMQIYNYVVVDVLFLFGFVDVLFIGSCVEGVVFVVQVYSSQKGMVQVVINCLCVVYVIVLGVVLIKFDYCCVDYGYFYNYGYSYGDEKWLKCVQLYGVLFVFCFGIDWGLCFDCCFVGVVGFLDYDYCYCVGCFVVQLV